MGRVYFKSDQCQNGSKNSFFYVRTRQQLNSYEVVLHNSHRLDLNKAQFSNFHYLNWICTDITDVNIHKYIRHKLLLLSTSYICPPLVWVSQSFL